MAVRCSGGGYSGGCGGDSRRGRGRWGRAGGKGGGGGEESTFRDASEREVAAAPGEAQADRREGRGGNSAEEPRAPGEP